MLDFFESPVDYLAATCCGSFYLAEGLYSSGESMLNSLLACCFYPLSLLYIREEIRDCKNITEDDICDDICGLCCKCLLINLIVFFNYFQLKKLIILPNKKFVSQRWQYKQGRKWNVIRKSAFVLFFFSSQNCLMMIVQSMFLLFYLI